jgi:DNA-binding response OmpR family regulator
MAISERTLIGHLPQINRAVVSSRTIMRLLLVEDEKKVSDLVARALRAERYAVDVADDGQQGWELAQSYDYDLIILDLMLPQLWGEELLRRVRRRNHQVPILILTARGTTEEKVQNFEAGADDYLTKPFAFAELVMRVKALLRRGPITRSSVLRVADLEVDRFTQQVRRGGRRIELTPKEYSLLEYLAANPGRVCSRTMIIEHVWDQSFEGLTNIVDVYVRHLRAKVDDPFPVKLIRTVRGVGYGLSETLEL